MTNEDNTETNDKRLKTSLLQSVEKQIQVLEDKLFETDQQNNILQKRVTRLEKTIEEIDTDKNHFKRE